MLEDRIKEDLKKALKEKKELDLLVLRLLISSIQNKQKEKKFLISQKENISEKDIEIQSQLSEEEVLEVLLSEAKKRKESIKSFELGGRKDLSAKEEKELEILSKYLPEEMSEEEVTATIKSAVQEVGATSLKDIGKVMALIMPKLKGKTDGSKINEIVKNFLE